MLADPTVTEVVAAPGNPGIAKRVPLDVSDAQAVAELGKQFDFVVIGPEAPLVAGAVDALAGTLVFGPTAAAGSLALHGSRVALSAMEQLKR